MRVFHPRFFSVTAVLCAAAAPATAAPQSVSADAPSWARAEAALDLGEMRAAESLFTLAGKAFPDPEMDHRREIAAARLAASRGDWRQTETRLRAWKDNENRREGSGEILFWLGWAALHQGRLPEADSLFVQASAYTAESRARDALEYRFAALLENSPALQDYLRGLPGSPLPASLRATSLERVPESSRLRPDALWQLALLREAQGDSLRAREILAELSRDASTLPGRRAAAYLALLREMEDMESSRVTYEGLILQYQQGVISEFARKRLKLLREIAPEGP